MIKLNAWEPIFIDEILTYRKLEKGYIRDQNFVSGVARGLGYFIPLLSTLICFWIYEIFYERLEVSEVYTLILVFNNLLHPVVLVIEAYEIKLVKDISDKRISDLLQLPEMENLKDDPSLNVASVTIEDLKADWKSHDENDNKDK